MFKSFFLNRQWMHWSVLGTVAIVLMVMFQVQLDVWLNQFFANFYDKLQYSFTVPGSLILTDYFALCLSFLKIGVIYVLLMVFMEFFIKHYVFRWRTAMADYYMKHWSKLRHVEGASQRIQEDTMRFARIVETIGVTFIRSLITLMAFLPILMKLSEHIIVLPWIGAIDNSLVYLAILSSLFGTIILAIASRKLPGLEFNNQKVEAAYRKELVFGEDDEERAQPPAIKELYSEIRKNYYVLYRQYLYFDVVKFSYLQSTVILPLIALGPTIVAGALTIGLINQIIDAFGRVDDSFKFLVNSWDTLIELASIYKRLKVFSSYINENNKGCDLSDSVSSLWDLDNA